MDSATLQAMLKQTQEGGGDGGDEVKPGSAAFIMTFGNICGFNFLRAAKAGAQFSLQNAANMGMQAANIMGGDKLKKAVMSIGFTSKGAKPLKPLDYGFVHEPAGNMRANQVMGNMWQQWQGVGFGNAMYVDHAGGGSRSLGSGIA